MAAQLNLHLTLPGTKATLVRDLITGQTLAGRERIMNKLLLRLQALSSGNTTGTMAINATDASTSATGTVTCASTVATNTVTINGVVFTAVASGATGNQFNIGGSDTLTAANIAAAINASVTALVSGVVTASSALAVVTLTAVRGGTLGNLNTLASSGSTVAVSGARLTGGADSSVTFNY